MAEEKDPVMEQFAELRAYIDSSHETLGNRLEKVETRLGGVEGRQASLERKVDSGFDRVERKLDALVRARRAPTPRRKP